LSIVVRELLRTLNDTLITTANDLVPGFRPTVPGKLPVRKAGRSGSGSRLARLLRAQEILERFVEELRQFGPKSSFFSLNKPTLIPATTEP
jgi:hypothetical protein